MSGSTADRTLGDLRYVEPFDSTRNTSDVSPAAAGLSSYLGCLFFASGRWTLVTAPSPLVGIGQLMGIVDTVLRD
jgi:hypothetical protein